MSRYSNHISLFAWLASWFVVVILTSTNPVFGFFPDHAVDYSGNSVETSTDSLVVDFADITIDIVGGDSLSVDPGAVVTVVYRIASQHDRPLTLTPHFDIPDGWSIVFGSQDIELESSSTVTRFVTYKVPEIELAGRYEPTFNLSDDSDVILASISSIVQVHSIHDLSLEAGSTPAHLAAGKSFEVPLTVANDGNARIEVSLNADDREYTRVELPKKRVSLDPGSFEMITARVTTDTDANRSQRIVVRFEAELVDDEEISTSTSVAFDIIPIYSRMRPKAANTPLSLSIETVGDESGANPQATIHASGKLFGGDVQVAATLAETPRKKLYGQEPQVTVQYERENVLVTVGDHSFQTSPMTLTGERGVGVATEYHRDSWSIKGTLQRSRTIIPVQERAALSASWRRSETSEISANLLHRNEFYSGTLFTLRGVTQPFGPTSKLDVECGISNGRTLQDPSCMIQTLGSTSRLSYRLNVQKASTQFPGTLAGTRMVAAFTSFKLAQGWRLEQMSTLINRNLGSGANRNNLYAKVGLNYSTRLSGGSLYSTIHGIRSTAKYDLVEGTTQRTENTLRVTTGYHMRTMGLTATLEQGRASNDASLTPGGLSRYRLNARYSPTGFLHLNGSMERSQGNLSSMAVDQTNRQMGLGATVTFKKDIQASIAAFRSSVKTHYEQQYSSIRSGLSKSFRSGRVLSITAQFNRNEGRQSLRTADYRIAFATPLELPFAARRAGSDIIRGEVINQETGQPIPDVLLFLGNDLAITDSKGRFRFVRPGNDIVFMRVDASSIGFDRTPAVPMPMEIGPERFNGETLIIPITRAATISGVIQLFQNSTTGANLIGASDSDLQMTGGLHGAVVQLESDDQRLRTRTGRDGSFEFNQLPSGEYTISVVRSELADDQRLETSTIKVLVEAGEATQLKFRVVPVKKQIRMIKSGNISLGSDGTSTIEVNTLTPTSESDAGSSDVAVPATDTDKSSAAISDRAQVSSDSTTSATLSRAGRQTPSTWISALKQTNEGGLKTAPRKPGVGFMPYYVEQGMTRESSSRPVYPLLFVLCILFLLVDLDLIVRSILSRRAGVMRQMREPVWMDTVRMGVLYSFTILVTTTWMGALAGLAVSLALSGLSVAIESKDTYRSILNIMLLQFVGRRGSGDWIAFRNVAAQLLDVSLETATLRHLNGMEEQVPTHRLHALADITGHHTELTAVHVELAFSRLSNLRQVREVTTDRLAELRPGHVSEHLHIHFEDADAQWTRLHLTVAVSATDKNRIVVRELIEAELLSVGISMRDAHPVTGTTPSLRVIGRQETSQSATVTSKTRIDSTSKGKRPGLRLIKGGDDTGETGKAA